MDSCDETRDYNETEGKTDTHDSSLAIKPVWIHPWDHQPTWNQIREEGIKQKQNKKPKGPDNAVVSLKGEGC